MNTVLVTGASGFVGLNLCVSLSRYKNLKILRAGRETSLEALGEMVRSADFIFHLAGVNRSENDDEFISTNVNLTEAITCFLRETGKKTPIVFSSSIHCGRSDIYGKSKGLAEAALIEFQAGSDSPVYIFRFPNIFGKWSKPDYNSVVSTFCYNIARNKTIKIDDEDAELTLIHIGDVITSFLNLMKNPIPGLNIFEKIEAHKVTVGQLAEMLHSYKRDRSNLRIGSVGSGFERQLYATFISYLPNSAFKYSVPRHSDDRGTFVEMLKTPNSGQISFFTAFPGVTRGGHYHHVKTEKFIVISGKARFCFKNIVTGEFLAFEVSGVKSEIIESIPGWSHDVKNVGDTELIVMVWANEIFDIDKPDTVARTIKDEEA